MPEDKGRIPSANDYFEFGPTVRDASGGRIPGAEDQLWNNEISQQLNSSEAKKRGAAGAYSYVSAPAGAAIGTAVGGPIGGIIGAVTGGLSGLSARKYADNAPPPSLGEMATTAGGEALGQGIPIGISAALKRGGPAFAEFLVRRFMGTQNPIAQEGTQAAIDFGLNPTVAQASKGRLASFIERNFAGKAKTALELEQQSKLQSAFGDIGTDVSGGMSPLNKEEYGRAAITELGQTKAGQQYLDKIGVLNPQTGTRNIGYPSKFLERFYSVPEKTRNFMRKIGPGGQEIVKGDYFDNVITPKVTDPVNGAFQPNWLIRELEDPNSVTREIYSSTERDGLLKFARAAQSVAPDTSEAGNWTMRWINGRIIMRAAGLVTGGLTRNIGAPGLEVGMEVGLGQFAKNVLMNPKYAAIAARLTKIPPSSYEAQSGMKTLLKVLGAAGGSAVVNLPNGIKQEVEITPAGKFKIPTATGDNQ